VCLSASFLYLFLHTNKTSLSTLLTLLARMARAKVGRIILEALRTNMVTTIAQVDVIMVTDSTTTNREKYDVFWGRVERGEKRETNVTDF
jgi:hypothetical protein